MTSFITWYSIFAAKISSYSLLISSIGDLHFFKNYGPHKTKNTLSVVDRVFVCKAVIISQIIIGSANSKSANSQKNIWSANRKSTTYKLPHLRKFCKSANLRIGDLRNLFANRPPLPNPQITGKNCKIRGCRNFKGKGQY